MAKPYRSRRWRPLLPDPAACWLLSRHLGVSPVMAQVLYHRGLTTPEAAQAFMAAGHDQILDPFLLKDMDRAVSLIRQRITAGKSIMVYGDYDVDGVTGTTILVLALRALGATVQYYIPNRFSEGYGLNAGALTEIRQQGHDFVLSVDTGITAVEEAEAAKAMGMTLVVSDHHEPGPVLPDVPALINPKRPDCTYPFKGLSGVGVAFKLALALEAPGAWDLIDIVTLGTIADMVPLVGENRAIVKEGLQRLGTTKRPGLRALMEVAGVREPVTATHIGYALGPRINALGRMGSAMAGVDLLLTEDSAHARTLARHLDEENRSRQEVEAAILQEALLQAERQSPSEKEYVLVLAGEGWHHGVVGICASRVLEAYHRPAIMLSINGDEVRGSARSIPAFNMHRALSQVSDLFAKFGGHAAAAGMTLKRRDDLPALRQRLNALAGQWLRPEDLVPELRVDACVGLDQITDELMAELAQLEPFGIGNPAPVFAIPDLTVMDTRTMGKEQQHLRLLLRGANCAVPMEAVGWNLAPVQPSTGGRVHVAFKPEYDTFRGAPRLRLTLKDLKRADSSETDGMLPALVPDSGSIEWDPLTGLVQQTRSAGGQPAVTISGHLFDGRDHRLNHALAALDEPEAPVAATAQAIEDDEHLGLPLRHRYIEALARPMDNRVLVLVATPWAASALARQLQMTWPDWRDQVLLWLSGTRTPRGGRVVVAPYGVPLSGEFSDIVLLDPPFHSGQVHGERVHLLWQSSDWDRAETVLGWPYPDRDTLVVLYKLLRSGETSAAALAEKLGEIPGPWNDARFRSGIGILRELGLVDAQGRLMPTVGTKFDLDNSETYRRGMLGRLEINRLRASDWPILGNTL